MNDDVKTKPSHMTSGQIIKLVVGIIVFGVLMGIRPEFEQVWMRALVAACAGGILGWAVLQARKSEV